MIFRFCWSFGPQIRRQSRLGVARLSPRPLLLTISVTLSEQGGTPLPLPNAILRPKRSDTQLVANEIAPANMQRLSILKSKKGRSNPSLPWLKKPRKCDLLHLHYCCHAARCDERQGFWHPLNTTPQPLAQQLHHSVRSNKVTISSRHVAS